MIMGFYGDRIVPHLLNISCGTKDMDEYRQRACAGLNGGVVEIGFGSGLNIPFYPGAVTQVTAVDPSEVAWKLADKRIRVARVPIRWAGLDGQALPFEDGSFDTALSTWTLCTIPDVATALREVRRVLRPGGTLHFAEHGLAPDDSVRRWQWRLDPLEQRLAGGCHFTRPIASLIADAGFAINELDVFYAKRTPKVAGAFSLGVAA
jgi:ubiquinone/menaquinone biosynthesis C-methylase UbiE